MTTSPSPLNGLHDLVALGHWAAQIIAQTPPDVALKDVGDTLAFVNRFVGFPPLTIASTAFEISALVAKGYETGAIRSADPQTPAMLRAAGPDNPSL